MPRPQNRSQSTTSASGNNNPNTPGHPDRTSHDYIRGHSEKGQNEVYCIVMVCRYCLHVRNLHLDENATDWEP